MSKKILYEGKAKQLYETEKPSELIQFFKDDATAFNKKKHEIIDSKGVLNNLISEYIFIYLGQNNIPNHFIKRLSPREQLIKRVEIIPIEVVVRANNKKIIENERVKIRVFNININEESLASFFNVER